MDRAELISLRLAGQMLLTPGKNPAEALCGLQAQYLRHAVHAMRLRTADPDVTGHVRTWTLRGTMHLIPRNDLPLYLRRCGTAQDVCDSGWYRWTASRGHANASEREAELAAMTLQAIENGVDERDALRAYLRAEGMNEVEEARAFNPWGGLIGEMAQMGLIACRVEMADAAHPVETKRYCRLDAFTPLAEDEAQRELLRRYLLAYGPVTLRDAAYFFHRKQNELREDLEALGAAQIRCEDRVYYHACPDAAAQEIPMVRLLAGFDPMLLGYRKEDNPILPEKHLRGIFNLTGIVHPAVLLRGRVVGRWKEKAGRLTVTAFETIGVRDRRRIEAEAERWFALRRVDWE